MMSIAFWIAVGAFLGWNFPQPVWATNAQMWVMNKWNELTNNDNKK